MGAAAARCLLGCACALSLAVAPPSAADTEVDLDHLEPGPSIDVDFQFPYSDFLFGNWLGARDLMFDYGLDFRLHYTSQPMYNAAGGQKKGGTYLHNLGLDILWDFETFGIPNTSLLVRLSNRDGDSVSKEEVAPREGGNTFVVQEIHGEQTAKVVNVQLNVNFFEEHVELAIGRLVAFDDFTVTQYNCQFMNLAFCGAPRAAFLQNPGAWTVYPNATWGARIRLESPDRRWTLLGAVYDADYENREGDPTQSNSNNNGTDWRFGENGVLVAGELHYHNNRDSEVGLSGVFKVGGFWMNEDSEDIGKTDGSTVDGNGFLWFVGEHQLYRERDGEDEGLGAFGSFQYSLEDNANQMDYFVSFGLVYTGLLPWKSRSRDRTGLAFAHGAFSDALKTPRRQQGLPTKKHETVIELNHRFEVGHGIALQPDLQWIINPAGTRDIPDAFLMGGKIYVEF